jgi:uncharacterized protein YjbJ (UPF0337 family)
MSSARDAARGVWIALATGTTLREPPPYCVAWGRGQRQVAPSFAASSGRVRLLWQAGSPPAKGGAMLTHKDEVKGKLKEAEGKAQDAWGDLTEDPEDDAEGKAKQVEGQFQQATGKVKKALHNAID